MTSSVCAIFPSLRGRNSAVGTALIMLNKFFKVKLMIIRNTLANVEICNVHIQRIKIRGDLVLKSHQLD